MPSQYHKQITNRVAACMAAWLGGRSDYKESQTIINPYSKLSHPLEHQYWSEGRGDAEVEARQAKPPVSQKHGTLIMIEGKAQGLPDYDEAQRLASTVRSWCLDRKVPFTLMMHVPVGGFKIHMVGYCALYGIDYAMTMAGTLDTLLSETVKAMMASGLDDSIKPKHRI